MPRGCRRLTCGERCRTCALRKSGLSDPAIARQIGRDRTTVWREIRRNNAGRFRKEGVPMACRWRAGNGYINTSAPTGRPAAGPACSCAGAGRSRTVRADAIRAGATFRTARTSPSARRSWRRRSGSAAGRRTRSSARATAARWRRWWTGRRTARFAKGWAEDRGRGGRRAARYAAAARRPGPHDHGGQRQGVRGACLGGAGARGRVPLRDAVPLVGAGPERARERPGA